MTHVGGETTVEGDPHLAGILTEALRVASAGEAREGEDDSSRAHVHGFHTYPARMHPDTARTLIHHLSKPGDLILDPFAGSGTVLVEARASGRDAIGSDINPLAVRLARAKIAARNRDFLELLRTEATNARAFADERRKAKRMPIRRYPPPVRELFDPHVLLELDSLFAHAEKSPARVRADLELVLSAILIKLSRLRADTSNELVQKRLAAGFATRFFERKVFEWADRLEAFSELTHDAKAVRIEAHEGDARELTHVRDRSVSLVVTSPPYAATYDYVSHHALRLWFLGMSRVAFEEREIGARRRFRDLSVRDAEAQFTDELRTVLARLARALAPDGQIVLVIADSTLHKTVIDSAKMVACAAERASLRVLARASQARPTFMRGATSAKMEHALVLVHAAPVAKTPTSGANRPRVADRERANAARPRSSPRPRR